jgi:hypothetical protein
MKFFRDVVSHLIKTAFEGHAKFSVADSTAVGANPIRPISLDAVPLDEGSTIIALSWEGGEKLFEKTLSEQEASHQFDLISTDLSEAAALTKKGEYDAAKDLMKKLGQKYAENTGDIVDTNLPKLNTTQASLEKKALDVNQVKSLFQDIDPKYAEMLANTCMTIDEALMKGKSVGLTAIASQDDDKLWREAKITMQNLWFTTTDELLDYQKKQKSATGGDQDHIPLWDKNKDEKKPTDKLAPASLSYEDVEEQKAKQHDDMQEHIDEKIKTELESALQQKAASVFGPDQVELVEVLRKNGRNWDEIKKILVKDFGFDKDSTNIFVDEQRQGTDPTGVEVEPVKEDDKKDAPLTPPEDLVSPETHDQLLKDHEDKKKHDQPAEEPVIKEEAAKSKEDKDLDKYTRVCPSCRSLVLPEEMRDKNTCNLCHKDASFTPQDVMAISELDEIARADNDDIRKVASNEEWHTCPNCKEEWPCNEDGCEAPTKLKCNNCKNKKASVKTAADGLNPLQEPVQQDPTTPASHDVVPMGKKPLDHQAPQKGDRVFVSSDMSDEKAGFEGTFVSSYKSEGNDLFIVETDEGDLLDVAANRVVKLSDNMGAQEAEPSMAPTIDQQQKSESIQVTPKMTDLHSSQDEALAIKKEAELLLADVQSMGKTSYMFVKKGLEKHANDSAFEGNGWCRVWVTDDEVAADAKYAEALKIPDEAARIQALKEIARYIAHESLRLADSAGAKVGVQSWFDSLSPSDHDRIDWVALASPVNEADEDLKFEQEQMDKYGPDAVNPDFKDQVKPRSSLEPKVEKIAADGSKCIKCDKVHKLEDMVKNEHGAGYLCKSHASEWNKDASLKKQAGTTWYDIGLPDPPEDAVRVQHVSGLGGTIVSFSDKMANAKLDQKIKNDEETCRQLGLSWVQLERGDHPKGVYAIYVEGFSARPGATPMWTLLDANNQPIYPEGYKPMEHDKNPNPEPAIDTESSLKTAYAMKCKCGDRIGEHKDMKGACSECKCPKWEVMPGRDREILEKHDKKASMEKTASTDYYFTTPVSLAQLKKVKGLQVGKKGKDLFITDGDNYVWLTMNEKGLVDGFTRYGASDPEMIYDELSSIFGQIHDEHEMQDIWYAESEAEHAKPDHVCSEDCDLYDYDAAEVQQPAVAPTPVAPAPVVKKKKGSELHFVPAPKCPNCGNDNTTPKVFGDAEVLNLCTDCGNKFETKQASDFEKGISQNKTSADPVDPAKTQFKDYKITPKYAPKQEAVPATPEIDAVLSKMTALETNLATLETARQQIQAKMQEQMSQVDQAGNRVEMEAELQQSIEKAAVLISAVESKVVQWKDKLYTLQTEEVNYVPKLTPKETLSKIYAKFDGAEKYVQDVLNGMLSQAKKVMENTLIRWPNKKSELMTEADSSPLGMMNHFNEELMAALKLLSEPI